MRYHFFGYYVDDEGRPIANGNVSVYLAGTDTPAKVYFSETDPVGSDTPPQLQTASDGYFEFWVDDEDYPPTQRFKIILEKEGYATITLDNVQIMFTARHNQLLEIQGGQPGEYYHLTQAELNDLGVLRSGDDASALHHHDSLYYRKTEIDAWELIKNYLLQKDLDFNSYFGRNIRLLQFTNETGSPDPSLVPQIYYHQPTARWRYIRHDNVEEVFASERWCEESFAYKHIVQVPRDYDRISDALLTVHNMGGGIVYVRGEEYTIDTPLPAYPGVALVGVFDRRYGGVPKLIANCSPVVQAMEYTVDTWKQYASHYFMMSGFEIDGQGTQAKGIHLRGAYYVVLKGLHIMNFTEHGVLIESGDRPRIVGCYTENCTIGFEVRPGGARLIDVGGIGGDTAIYVKSWGAMLEGCWSYACNKDGMIVETDGCLIKGGFHYDNGQGGSGFAGIRIKGNLNKVYKVEGGNWSSPGTQDYVIYEEDGYDENLFEGIIGKNVNVDVIRRAGAKTMMLGVYRGV